jgi:hypothetical protein
MALVIAGFALVLAAIALMLVGLVIVGTQREAPWSGLDPKPPTPLAGFARNVLGLHVRKAPQTGQTSTDRLQPLGGRPTHPAAPPMTRPGRR